MTKPLQTIYAKDAKGAWVHRNPEHTERPIRVQIRTTKQESRGFTRIGYYHPTVGNHHEVVPSMTRLDLAP